MGCDMVAALPVATGGGETLFGANVHRAAGEGVAVRRVKGRNCGLGEGVRTQFLHVPQVRQTHTVFAIQCPTSGGYLCGVNEHRVVAGCSSWKSRCRCESLGLLGAELVRLTLERAHNATHALEILTDLIARHGQGSFPGNEHNENGGVDSVFLLADATQAFAVEAAGHDWAAQEIHQVRAASDVGVIRQDWYSLAHGLADRAIVEGWWPNDGTKLDFTEAVSESPTGKASALRRWGRATLLLEQQNGHLDAASLRRLLGDHYEGTHYEVDPLTASPMVTPLCRHAVRGVGHETAVSLAVQLPVDAEQAVLCWLAVGPPCVGVYFPLLFDCELPTAFSEEHSALWSRSRELAAYRGSDEQRWQRVRESMARLQTRFEHDVSEFLEESRTRPPADRRRLAGSLMQSHVERFEEHAQEILGERGYSTDTMAAAISGLADF